MLRTPIVVLSCLLGHAVFAQVAPTPTLSAEHMRPAPNSWKYHPGDDAAWIDPSFDDSGWESVPRTAFESDAIPSTGWPGIGWFRLHFLVDSTLLDQPLVLALYGRGAADVYLDGSLILESGRVGNSREEETSAIHSEPNPQLAFFQFEHRLEHVIAVRHSSFGTARFHKIGGPVAGVSLRLAEPTSFVESVGAEIRVYSATQFAFTGIPVAFSLLYALLFAFHREKRDYLIFALLSLGIAGMTFMDLQLEFLSEASHYMLVRRLFMATAILTVSTSVYFVYRLFETRRRLYFRTLMTGAIVLAVWGLIDPLGVFRVGNFVVFFALAEMVRIVARAIRRRKSGAWVVGTGLMAFVVGVAYDLLLDLDLIDGIAQVTNGYYYGFVGLTIAMATYLSQNVAKTSEELIINERRLREEEVTRRVLEADVARKTRELEEARALQLSMLPRELPVVGALDIAVHMETATEIGGDYYDFHLAADGSLTVVIGDATGHGLKAGIMVAIAKSLFKQGVDERDFPNFFNGCNRILRQMYLGNLFMAMTLLRFEPDRLVVSAAGMPPVLHYQSETGTVKEIVLKGMPLGAFDTFPYEQVETNLAAGDSVLLVTDGITELFNASREMLGQDRLRALFHSVADRSPEEVIDFLKTTVVDWRGDSQQEDDITLVVLKAR